MIVSYEAFEGALLCIGNGGVECRSSLTTNKYEHTILFKKLNERRNLETFGNSLIPIRRWFCLATIEERVIRNENSISVQGERLSAIEAILPHLATKADLKALENKLLALENKLFWVGIGISTALVVNIVMTLLG